MLTSSDTGRFTPILISRFFLDLDDLSAHEPKIPWNTLTATGHGGIESTIRFAYPSSPVQVLPLVFSGSSLISHRLRAPRTPSRNLLISTAKETFRILMRRLLKRVIGQQGPGRSQSGLREEAEDRDAVYYASTNDPAYPVCAREPGYSWGAAHEETTPSGRR